MHIVLFWWFTTINFYVFSTTSNCYFFFFFTFLSTVTGLVRGHVGPGLSTVEAWDQHGSIFYLAFCLTQSILCYPLMTSIDIWFVYLVV